MPTITKAATPLRMPRYWIPKTTWYRKRATRQLRPMLAIPKKDRNTGEARGTGDRAGGPSRTHTFSGPDPHWVLPHTPPPPGSTFTTPTVPSTAVYAQGRGQAGGLSGR